ncbi:MAG: dihydroxy-acid dehydratase [Nitrospinota bacterium]|nr:dihydroxy-acid dehydratase [Nitrospinota bacterium]
MIQIDIENNRVDVDLKQEELKNRSKSFKPKEIKYKKGVLAKYAKVVSSASRGAVTD